jgi:hypothetical protein
MKRLTRSLILLCIPMLLVSCSMNKSDSLLEQDLDTVNSFCNDYSKLRDWNLTSVLDIESDYSSNVAILNEKYPESLELKQLDISVQLAFQYADWVRAELVAAWDNRDLPVEVVEQGESLLGNNPPAPAKALTEGIAKSCESFKN